MTNAAKTKELEKFASQFWEEREKEAEAAGVHVIQYMAQVDGGILKPVIVKMLRHAKAHPGTCPPDCSWQSSMRELKKKYGVE